MKKLSHLTRSSLILIIFFGLDKVVAFLRSIIIARQFSLSFELDAFNIANNLPDLLFALISGGAMTMALIPVLSEVLTLKGRPAAWRVFSSIANLTFLITGGLAIVITVFANEFVAAEMGIAPGFGPQQQTLIADLMRLNLIATMIFSISGLVMGGLQANQHFLLPAMAPLLYNLGQITGALVLSPAEPYTFGPVTLPALGLGVHGLVYGVILGALLHLAIQVPGLIKYEFRWTPRIELDQGMIEAVKLIVPRVFTMLFIQFMFIARDNFASRLDQIGAASSLTYGWMIVMVPETLLATAIATVMLPTLSKYAAQKDWSRFKQTLDKALQIFVALLLPIGAIIAAGLKPLVQAAFGFDAAGTNLLTLTTRVYMLTLAGYAVQELMARAFYARKKALVPLATVVLRIFLYIGIGLTILKVFPHPGAPVIAALELAITVEAVIMLIWLNKQLPEKISGWNSLMRGLAAALAAGVVTFLVATYLPGGAVTTALAGMLAGMGIALPFAWKEIRLLFDL
ncbi:MAG: hypothetical protein JXA13_01190 [Anaerolineales bacterium]|nr:hypothetical protein [Anaerolineales bacterium]